MKRSAGLRTARAIFPNGPENRNYYWGLAGEKSILADHFLDHSLVYSPLSPYDRDGSSRKEKLETAPGNDPPQRKSVLIREV